MSEKIKAAILLMTMGLGLSNLYGQSKYEKEHRLKLKNVPAPALGFINYLEVGRKIRWYAEEGLDSKSVEAKFKYKDQKYSVEFDTAGNLQDIEIEMEWSELPVEQKDTILSQLAEDCIKYKIYKTQIQYSGDPTVLQAKIKTGENNGDYSIRYEIVVKCRNSGGTNLFEYLFSDSGRKISVSEIIFKNASNLEY